MKNIEIGSGPTLKDYASYASLYTIVRDFEHETDLIIGNLQNRKIKMVNSTDKGGGVAEMLPTMIRMMRELGLDADWSIIESQEKEFFNLTKRIHNLIHGKGVPGFTEKERAIFEAVNRKNAEEFLSEVNDGDILIIHDPQPMPLARFIKEKKDVICIWRCHIGLDKYNEYTSSAWEFLKPYFKDYDYFIFTDAQYIPPVATTNVSIITPAIDPLSHKNRDLFLHKLSGILRNADLIPNGHPKIATPFAAKARRVQPDGTFGSPLEPDDLGLMFRPIVTQISRWDRLKGFAEMLKGFVELKNNREHFAHDDKMHRRRLDAVRLVLAGPDPDFIKDDPEGRMVLDELIELYKSLPEELARDIAIILLPMQSTKENALIVNALQRCSSMVLQNSLEEGFGLTATEAMWKCLAVMGTHANGLQIQIRDRLDGILVHDPEDINEIAFEMNQLLRYPKKREVYAYSAQRRVINNYLVFNQIYNWIKLMVDVMNQKDRTAVKN